MAAKRLGSHSSIRRLGKALSVSALNQIVSSGTNFAVTLYLVRSLDSAEFGLYGIAFAVALFYAGIANALLVTQMVVHFPEKSSAERPFYAGRMLALLSAFCIVSAAILGVIVVATLLTVSNSVFIYFGPAVMGASIGLVAKDFFVRHAFVTHTEAHALIVNVALAAALVMLLIGVQVYGGTLDASLAIAIYGLAHVIASLLGFLTAGLRIQLRDVTRLRLDFTEAWGHGRWAIGQSLVDWARSQAHAYIGIIFLGPAALGLLNAARVLTSPVLFLLPAISQVLLPRLAELRHAPEHALFLTRFAAAGLLAVALIYTFALMMNLDPIAGFVLGDQYAFEPDLPVITAIWCAVMCAQVLRTKLSALSQAFKLFRGLTYANLVAAVLAVTSAVAFLSAYAAPGAALGALTGELVLLFLIWRLVRRSTR